MFVICMARAISSARTAVTRLPLSTRCRIMQAGFQEDSCGRGQARAHSGGALAPCHAEALHGDEPRGGASADVQDRDPQPPGLDAERDVSHGPLYGLELETVQDYIEKVKIERGFVKEVENDRASQRTTMDNEYDKLGGKLLCGGRSLRERGRIKRGQSQPAMPVRTADGGAADPQAGRQLPEAVLPVPQVQERHDEMFVLPVAGGATLLAGDHDLRLSATVSGGAAASSGAAATNIGARERVPASGQCGCPVQEHLLCRPNPVLACAGERMRNE